MRIDDENKVVWCSEVLVKWKESFNGKPMGSIIYRIARVGYGYSLEDMNGNEIDYSEWGPSNQFRLIKAVIDDYEFKLEQPKKYYWRKKKEYLAWFEDVNFRYLNNHKPTESTLLTNIDNLKSFTVKFTEQEARDLLKDDFDKFEKVECE